MKVYKVILLACITFICGALIPIGVYQTNIKTNESIIQNQKDSISVLTGEVAQIKFDFENYKDSISINDTMIYENFILRYKINRIKQYDSIVIRNSSQSKYFRGWVRRVIYDY